jgi:hypothetical protein
MADAEVLVHALKNPPRRFAAVPTIEGFDEVPLFRQGSIVLDQVTIG